MVTMLEIILPIILIIIIAFILYNIIKGIFKVALIGVIVVLLISILSGFILKGQIQELAESEEFYIIYRNNDDFIYGYLLANEIIPIDCEILNQIEQRYNEKVDIDRPLLIFDSGNELKDQNITINNYEFSNSQKQTILDSNNPTKMINTILDDQGYEQIDQESDGCVVKFLFLDFQNINKSKILQEDYELYPGNFWINMFHQIPFDFVKKNMLKVSNYVARNNISINSSTLNETINNTMSKFNFLKNLMDKTE